MSEQVEQGPTAAFVRPFDQEDIIVLSLLPTCDHIIFGFVAGVFAWRSAKEEDN